MICARCLRSSRALRPSPASLTRSFTSSRPQFEPSTTASPRTDGTPAATSTGAAQPFSTPLSPTPNPVSQGQDLRGILKGKEKKVVVESICPAGTPLKGLNYLKGREDPVALAEDEYPEWLWRCLDAKVKDGEDKAGAGDEFSKSKKSRRLAAKRQRKLEEQMLLSGNTEALAPKVPLTAQSIDLPANEEGSVRGALEADGKREEVRKAMRQQRRAAIKERNFLGSM